MHERIDANIINETSLVTQEVVGYSKEEVIHNKIYASGRFIGIINDLDYLYELIENKYKDYEKDFPNSSLGLSDDVYISQEKSYVLVEDVDEDIFNYLLNNDLLGIRTTSIELSTASGVYDIIYVKDYEDFNNALEKFYLNFISSETLDLLRNNVAIASPSELGTVEKNIVLYETITKENSIVSISEILKTEEEIYNYLCYGRNEDRAYYTVREGDTLAGVGHHFSDMSPKQLVMLNQDILSSENQVITPGMELNVTYYTSPITIEVTKEKLSQQYIVPEAPEYVEDDSLEIGSREVRVQEESGIRNVLYEEKWINGVLDSGKLLSENVIKEPKRGVIAVGTKQVIMIGTGNYIWPVENPAIICHFGCYGGHTGTDIVNLYERYTAIYAVDSGVVDDTGYKSDMGNYCIINHQNGVRTWYMHMNEPAYVTPGQSITRGQIIGQMGSTGYSTAVHLHLTFEVGGVRVNACNYLPCSTAG